MSQGNYNAPPPASSGGGMSTMMIVLIVLGVLGLVCVGACGVCYWGAQTFVQNVGGAFFAEVSMGLIRENQEVKDELGEPLTQENAKFTTSGNTVVIDFDVKGPKGTGQAHAEFTGADPNPAPGAQPKPGVITVKLPSGKTVNVSTEPTFDDVAPEMPDEPGDTDASDAGAPSDSTEM